jgi:YD repeat-containing protein
MKKIVLAIVVVLVLLAAYLTLWPVPIKPVSWNAPMPPGYVGPHAVNTKLTNLKMISIGTEIGPEHIAIGKDGKLYTTVASGNILRMNPDGSALEVFVNTGGRVLGFDFDASGNLIAADSNKGLLSISPDRKITLLTDKVNGDPIRYADAVASVLDILEQSSTGRILEYDPAKKTTRVVAKGFSFANGIALSLDEQTLFVNETGKYRVWKISVSAKDLDISIPSGQAEVLFDNLPGYPDNLMRGLNGKIWLGFAKPRNPTIDKLATKPFMRQLTIRLPRAMWPVPKSYGHVFAFTEDGKVVADLQDPSGAYPETTAVTETADRLYIQSLHAKGLGWMPK